MILDTAEGRGLRETCDRQNYNYRCKTDYPLVSTGTLSLLQLRQDSGWSTVSIRKGLWPNEPTMAPPPPQIGDRHGYSVLGIYSVGKRGHCTFQSNSP